MYNTSTELIDCELSDVLVKPIHAIFKSASIIYRDLIKSDTFSSVLVSNINGLLLNYIIQKHFEPQYISKEFPFKTSISKKGKHKIIEMQRNKILLTVNKAKKNSLPAVSNYKRDYSTWNFGLNRQFQIRLDGNTEKPGIITDQYYGIVTYTLKKFEYDFIDIVIPDSSFSEVLDKVELLSNLKIMKSKSDYSNDDDNGIILSEENIKKGLKDEIARTLNSL